MEIKKTFIVRFNKKITSLFLLKDGSYVLDNFVFYSSGFWQKELQFISKEEAQHLISMYDQAEI